MFAFAWQFWAWDGSTLIMAIILFVLLTGIWGLADGDWWTEFLIVISLFIFVIGGLVNDGLAEHSERVEREEQAIIHMLEEHGHDVVTLRRTQGTVQLRNECDEVWGYELEGDHSDGSLGINPDTETLVAGSSDESQVFGPACPSPYQEWSSSIADEDIVRMFEDKGLNVAAVSSYHMTIELLSECDEVWGYELYGDHSDGSLGINPDTETLVAGSSDESQVFGPACPSPYEDWRS